MAKIKPQAIKLKDATEIVLRSPVAEDAQSLINYCTQIYASSDYVVTEPDEYISDVKNQKKWIEDFDGKEGTVCILAELDGKVIGSLDFRNNAGRRRIQHRGEFGMGVVKPWRGKGVGKALVARLVDWAKESTNPVEKIELMVMQTNDPAKKLYQSFGFKQEGRIFREIKMPDGSYIDGIAMGLWL